MARTSYSRPASRTSTPGARPRMRLCWSPRFMSTPDRTSPRAWILAAARASFVAGGALPWALPFARASLPLGPIGTLLDGMFFLMCHRRPARTLVLAGVPMPLCSRCAGVALGLALGGLIAWPSPSARATRIAVAAATLLMIADIVTQDLGIHPVWHWSRITTGALFGYALAIGLFAIIRRERTAPAR
jgi:uncharacterized membrane protein